MNKYYLLFVILIGYIFIYSIHIFLIVTFLSPYYQRPLELGADIAIHSTTKYFDGHNATVGGAVIAKSEELDESIRFIQNASGVIMSPWVAWLTLQGVKTLSVRMDRQSANAQTIAEFLENHSKVITVAYPGLPSFGQHELAKKQSDGFGGMLCWWVPFALFSEPWRSIFPQWNTESQEVIMQHQQVCIHYLGVIRICVLSDDHWHQSFE